MSLEAQRDVIRKLIDDGINAWKPQIFDEVFGSSSRDRAHRDF